MLIPILPKQTLKILLVDDTPYNLYVLHELISSIDR